MKYEIDAETIKGLRVEEGLSQRAFANKYNIPVRTLQEWEQGRSTPPTYVATLINKASNMNKNKYPSIEELFSKYEGPSNSCEMPSDDLVGKELL